jgi:tyrosine phenol-lyase
MQKARMVQKVQSVPVDGRVKPIEKAGYNTFVLKTKDIFLDMLTTSGVNPMSDNQFASMMKTDDAYAGSMTFYEFAKAVEDILAYKHVVNVHQGRAPEHLLPRYSQNPAVSFRQTTISPQPRPNAAKRCAGF